MTDQDHSSLVEKATAIVAESRLPVDDKKLLVGRIPFVADVMLQMFVEVCQEDPFSIDAIVKSLKKIHEVVKQERQEIEEALAAG